MYLDKILSEFPQQFKGQKNIEVVIRAFSKQLEELREMFADLEQLRSLESAKGKQLDGVGDIVVLSRSQAGLLAGEKITFPVIDDDRYKKYLKYKVLKNTNTCTYYDIIYGLTMLYGKAIEPVYYSEDPDLPATIILEMPLLKPGGVPATLGDVPPIKAAGVAIQIMYRIKAMVEIRSFITFGEYEFQQCGEHLCGTLPWQYQIGQIVRRTMEVGAYVTEALYRIPLAGTLMCPGEDFQYQLGNLIKSAVETNFTAEFADTAPDVSGQKICGDGFLLGQIIEEKAEAESVILHALSELHLCGPEACGIYFTKKVGEQ